MHIINNNMWSSNVVVKTGLPVDAYNFEPVGQRRSYLEMTTFYLYQGIKYKKYILRELYSPRNSYDYQ